MSSLRKGCASIKRALTHAVVFSFIVVTGSCQTPPTARPPKLLGGITALELFDQQVTLDCKVRSKSHTEFNMLTLKITPGRNQGPEAETQFAIIGPYSASLPPTTKVTHGKAVVAANSINAVFKESAGRLFLESIVDGRRPHDKTLVGWLKYGSLTEADQIKCTKSLFAL